MPLQFRDRASEREIAFKAYSRLSSPAQTLMQMMAMMDIQVKSVVLSAFLGKAQVKDDRGEVMDADTWKNIIQECVYVKVLDAASGYVVCRQALRNLCARHTYSSGKSDVVAALCELYQKKQMYFVNNSFDPVFNLRASIASGKAASFFRSRVHSPSSGYYSSSVEWAAYFGNPFNADNLNGVALSDQRMVLTALMHDALLHTEPADAICRYLEMEISDGHDMTGEYRYLLGFHLLLRGENERAAVYCNAPEAPAHLKAVEAAIGGDTDRALDYFATALKEHRKFSGRHQGFFNDFSDVIYIACMIRKGTSFSLASLYRELNSSMYNSHDRNPANEWISPFFSLFDEKGIFLRGRYTDHFFTADRSSVDPIGMLINLVIGHWLTSKSIEKHIEAFIEVFDFVQKRGFKWVASEMAELIFRISGKKQYQGDGLRLRGAQAVPMIVDAVRIVDEWERVLDALQLIGPGAVTKKESSQLRFIWHLGFSEAAYRNEPYLEGVEQKILKSGRWNAGKRISIITLAGSYQHKELLTDQDRLVIAILANESNAWSNDNSYQALAELAGHPAVYWNNGSDTPLEILVREPYLLVEPHRGGFRITLEPPFNNSDAPQPYLLKVETSDRIILYSRKACHAQIAHILGKKELIVPSLAKEKLLRALSGLAPQITIHNELPDSLQSADKVASDDRLHFRLSANGAGLKIEVLVRPVAEGRFFVPGLGTEIVHEVLDKKPVYTRRDLNGEKKTFQKVLCACPVLGGQVDDPQEPVYIDTALVALEVLGELNAVKDTVELLWNDKKPIKVSSPLSMSDASLRIRPAGDWFGIDGTITIGEGQVIAIRTLLDLLDATPGRFLPLDENRFIAITREFRRQLDRLRACSVVANGSLQVHPLSTFSLEDIVENLPEESICEEWKNRVERMRSVLNSEPKPPKSFQGELRDYQKEGFVWLSRLAQLGAGACLADDMGLGKTIQAIALLLDRAGGGPALVIAPTSVCMNWIDELTCFAPTLHPVRFGDSDRETSIKNAGSSDVVVCSYGLVNSETALLTSRSWHTIILDEAQAIKNMATQRSKAVMELAGDFRLVTTGTPVENHLGELWNLFRFINPGLLGSLEKFTTTFALPIERDNDVETRHRLKTIINPFILRRMKSQVLDELPPKTEVLVHVDMSDEEKALYEALRQKAIEELAEQKSVRGQHIRILAHIMKLRRACCHPSLVAPESGINGSKLEAFSRCLDELIENNHRALVFSQFVDHLSIVKQLCDDRTIDYQYLDGSTPARERSERINAFQRGQGTLFLMSLKAGGVGVNLTAADYVILLDPWWNPAVEDQAAARAYRIGQQRPVTIYRLITRGSIEEKIMALHKKKRDLAESLLEGGDMSGKVSADELMKLIRDTVEQG